MGYKIDGVDLLGHIGFLASANRKSIDSFERPRDTRPVEKYEWEDFTEYDLNASIHDKERVFILDGILEANSETDYKIKKANLDAIRKRSKVTIYASEVDQTVNARFKQFTNWERLTHVKGRSRIVTRVTMEFDELLNLPLPTYGLYYGPSGTLPVTANDALALNAIAFSNEVILNTGTTHRFLNVLVPPGKFIVSMTDLDALFGDISYVNKGSITIEGTVFTLYSFEVAIPYSINHRHKIILA